MTTGTCSRQIDIEFNPQTRTIDSVVVYGGCNGNLKGISALVRGQKIDDVIASLEGITCGSKPTSCPDQLAQALKSCAKQCE